MDGISGVPFSSILQQIEHGLANGSQNSRGSASRRLGSGVPVMVVLFGSNSPMDKKGQRPLNLVVATHPYFFIFIVIWGNFMIQFDDERAYFCRKWLVKNYQVVYEIIPV